MEDPTDRTKDLVEDALEAPKELLEEAEVGSSERTPWIVLSAVVIAVGAFVVVVLIAVLLVYYLI